MRGSAPRSQGDGVEIRLSAATGPATVSIRAPSGVALADHRADATLAATLLPAMRMGVDLTVDGPVSSRLLEGARTVQDVFWTWDRTLRPTEPWYRRVEVTAPPAGAGESSPGRGTAAFFTGGVDSFYTALVHREALDGLVFVHGFDVPLGDTRLRAEISRRIGDAAATLGLPLIEVETDLRRLGDDTGVPWPDYHGAALATVALLLAPGFSRVLVPATHTYGHLEGLGSHPLIDPLWSTDEVRIVHDGADATRVDKLRTLAGDAAAREHLRVCWENPGGVYNCGRCEKCVRTGAAIRIAGAEGQFPTVAPPSLRDVASARVTGRGSEWHDLRAELVRTGANPRLQRAIDLTLARHQLSRWSWTQRWTP